MENRKEKKASKRELSESFILLARLLEILRENPFKIRTYRFAARMIRNLPNETLTVRDIEELGKIKGIGKAIVKKSLEFLEKGEIGKLTEVKASFPDPILKLAIETKLPSKVIAVLWKDYDITTPEGILEFINNFKEVLKITESEKRKIKALFI
ncbi:hypothetical protein [Kosmotoga pacifica]|uniref:Crossover junction endonuclease MUS81-like HHH domain-containing protein n=1 Tax=Kosmotoga pacifica TaxID=1330330 RepID=A0A0G2ZCJ0_9BACT|nr:hypothetical protein [Kosmotoga pacifica]AKI97264.1 hypothetical protein IX53_04915 [Kosmotoga pacifica]